MNRLVIKGNRIVVPFEQREQNLQQLHIGHFGIEKTKQSARHAIYWPRLTHISSRSSKDVPGTLVGTTKGAHGEPTDSNETIPDDGRRSVRVR